MINAKRCWFLRGVIIREKIIRMIPMEKSIVVVPKKGIKKYPARNVPKILPAVEMA